MLLSLAPSYSLSERQEKGGSFKNQNKTKLEGAHVERMGRDGISFLHTEKGSVGKLRMSYKQLVLVTTHIAASVYVHKGLVQLRLTGCMWGLAAFWK